MKKNILFIILFNVIMCQGEQPYPHTNLVSIPTAGTMPKGFYSFENIFMNNGSIVPKFMIGITDNFTLGMSFGISNFIGIGELKKFKSYPEVQIKYRIFDETQSIPALVIGIDTQGRGEFHEKYLPTSNILNPTRVLNRYDQKSYGVYLVLSRNFSLLGNLGFHFGLNKNISENDDKDDDLNIFFGFDKEINKSFSLFGEYNFARDDDYFNGDESADIENLIDRDGKGYLNAGLRWSASNNLMLEINVNDIFKNNKSFDSMNRELKVIYFESF